MVALVSTAVGASSGPRAVPGTPRPRRAGPPRSTGACSGPSTQATWLAGQLQHLVEVAEQMAGRLLGPQVAGPDPGIGLGAVRPPARLPPGRLGGSRPGGCCTRSRAT